MAKVEVSSLRDAHHWMVQLRDALDAAIPAVERLLTRTHRPDEVANAKLAPELARRAAELASQHPALAGTLQVAPVNLPEQPESPNSQEQPGANWKRGVARSPQNARGGNVHEVKVAHPMPNGGPGQIFCRWTCHNTSVNATRLPDDAEVTCKGCLLAIATRERMADRQSVAAAQRENLRKARAVRAEKRKTEKTERDQEKAAARAARPATSTSSRPRPLKAHAVLRDKVADSQDKLAQDAQARAQRAPSLTRKRKKSEPRPPVPLKRYDMTSGLPEMVNCPCGCPKRGYLNKNTGHTRDCMCIPCEDHRQEVIDRVEARRERATRSAGLGGL